MSDVGSRSPKQNLSYRPWIATLLAFARNDAVTLLRSIIVTLFLLYVTTHSALACTQLAAPIINVVPQTHPIIYDFDTPTAALGQLQRDKISPYGIEADTTTGGLRHDQPEYKLVVYVESDFDPNSGLYCLWYRKIDLHITLQPKIFVAKEFNQGNCRSAIIEHEQKHVVVDRLLINKYAKKVGNELSSIISNIGAEGPFPLRDALVTRRKMIAAVRKIIEEEQHAHIRELNILQNQIDSLEEYKAVSSHCQDVRLR